MKLLKFSAIILCLCLLIPAVAGCESVKTDTGGIRVVCTVFPYYDWTKNITEGTSLTPTLLVKNGADLHSYNASVSDIIAISSCDLLVMTGGESDAWVEAALAQAQNENIKVIRLLDILEAEGLAIALEESRDHDHGEHCDHLLDEHIWLSPKIAEILVGYITRALCELDANEAAKYTENSVAYREKLKELDADFRKSLAPLGNTPLLFADRFPFRYLTQSYGLSYFAAFDSCSSDSEASFKTVSSLVAVINEHSLPCVFMTESSTGELAYSVISSSAVENCRAVALDSMQSVTEADVENGANYIEIMRSNLTALCEAIG